MKQPKLNGRQARWCIYLAPYNFIKHRAGKLNPADAPSRRPDYEGEPVANTELLPVLEKRIQVQPILRSRKHDKTSLPEETSGALDQSRRDEISLERENLSAYRVDHNIENPDFLNSG